MRVLLGIFTLGLLLMAPTAASAALYTPTPADLGDLDHYQVYAWKINVTGQDRTGTVNTATLTFNNIYNWDNSANRLFLHLFDTNATTIVPNMGSGSNVLMFTDPVADPTIANYFSSVSWTVGNTALTSMAFPGLPGQGAALSAPDTTTGAGNPGDQMASLGGNTWRRTDATNDDNPNNQNNLAEGYWTAKLGDVINSKQHYDYTYTFSAAEVTALNSYVDNDGWIALGLDPDCHFYNTGVELNLTSSPASQAVPEPASLLLVGSGLAIARAVRKRRAAASASQAL